jgi:hypothetical protein
MSLSHGLVAIALGLLAGSAVAQDASQGYRLYNFTSTIKGTVQSCLSCHGADPRTPPNAMLNIGSINPACGRSDWPVGTAHSLKGLCNIGPTASQADAEARFTIALGVPLMAQFAAANFSAQERRDIAAFLLASYLGTPVPFARPEYREEGATSATGALDFGSVNDGATATKLVYFVNGGNHPMTIGAGFTLAGSITGLNQARYTVTATVPAGETACAAGLALAAGARCGLTVTFSPDTSIAAGALQTATLTIPSNGGSGISQLNLNGARAVVAAPTLTLNPAGNTYAAGPTPAGTSINFAPVTVTNSGPLALSFTSINITGANAAEFSRATGGTNCAVGTAVGNGGGTCTLQFTFAPPAGATGTRTATVEIVSNAPGSPLTLTLSGTVGVVTPLISFGTTSNTNQAFLRLQAAAVGTPVSGVVTIRNPGAAGAPSLTITNIQLSAGAPTFSITPGATDCLSAPVAPGGSCSLSVTYTAPDMAVPHNGNIVITSNGRTTVGTEGPHNLALEGTVVVPGSGTTTAQAPNMPASVRFTNTPVNTQSAQVERVTIVNTGASALTVQARLGAGTASDFTVLNNCSSVAVGSSCAVDVRFRPRGEGTRSDTLAFSYNGGSLPSIQLSGTGQAASAAGQGAGGGALSLPTLLVLAAGTLLACSLRRRPG